MSHTAVCSLSDAGSLAHTSSARWKRRITVAGAVGVVVAGCCAVYTSSFRAALGRRSLLGDRSAAANAAGLPSRPLITGAMHRAGTALPILSADSGSNNEAGSKHDNLGWMFADQRTHVEQEAAQRALPEAAGGEWHHPAATTLHTGTRSVTGWGQALVSAGDNRHRLKHRYGLFGQSIVMELRSDMLAIDPSIDEYNTSRQVMDQIGVFIVIVGTVVGAMLLYDTSGLRACLGNRFREEQPTAKVARVPGSSADAWSISSVFSGFAGSAPQREGAAETDEAGSLLGTFRGLDGSATAREPNHGGGGKDGTSTARSAPGTFKNMFGSGNAKTPTPVAPAQYGAAVIMTRENLRTAAAIPPAPTLAERMGLGGLPSQHEEQPGQTSRELQGSGFQSTGLGLENPWEPTPTLFFVMGILCQLPLMIALCCYTFFAELFAGAGADGLSYFPVIVSVAQVVTSLSVSTVLREWNWMVKAVTGLLIAVPAVLIVPVSPSASLCFALCRETINSTVSVFPKKFCYASVVLC